MMRNLMAGMAELTAALAICLACSLPLVACTSIDYERGWTPTDTEPGQWKGLTEPQASWVRVKYRSILQHKSLKLEMQGERTVADYSTDSDPAIEMAKQLSAMSELLMRQAGQGVAP